MAKTLTEQNKDLTEQLSVVERDLMEAREREATIAQDFANADQTVQSLTAKVSELDGVIAGHVATITAKDAEIARLMAAVEQAEKSAGKKAQDALSAIGVPAIDGDAVAAKPTKDELMAEYNRLAKTDFAAARAFWKKHETVLQDPKLLAALQRH